MDSNSDNNSDSKKPSGFDWTGAIAFLVMVALIGGCSAMCSSGGSSSHKDYSTEETAEFLDNIDTPGTSEYKWYHDEYLPDNNLPAT